MIGFRNAFFSLSTWLRTIYCLQTIDEPACVILTLFQFFLLFFVRKRNFCRRSFYYVHNLTLFVFQSLHLCKQYSHYPSYRARWRCGLHHKSSWFISLQWLMWRWSKYYAVVSTGNTDSNLETRTSNVLLCKERCEKQMRHGLNAVFVPQKEQNFQMNRVIVYFSQSPNYTGD